MAKRYYEKSVMGTPGLDYAGRPKEKINCTFPDPYGVVYTRPYDSIEGGIDKQIREYKKFKPASSKY